MQWTVENIASQSAKTAISNATNTMHFIVIRRAQGA
jgi:hypothetical protein